MAGWLVGNVLQSFTLLSQICAVGKLQEVMQFPLGKN